MEGRRGSKGRGEGVKGGLRVNAMVGGLGGDGRGGGGEDALEREGKGLGGGGEGENSWGEGERRINRELEGENR